MSKQSFEDRLERLSVIVNDLEDGELPLEEGVALFKEGLALAKSAGAAGMVGGQAMDMELTGRGNVALDELRRMHAMKTGALIGASCVGGAILAGASLEDVQAAADYGRDIGVAFQIVDDILDVVGTEAELGKPVGSDEQQGKTTYPTLLGLDESRQLAQGYVDKAVKALAYCEGEDADFLRELALYIVKRAS